MWNDDHLCGYFDRDAGAQVFTHTTNRKSDAAMTI